MKDIPGYEGLYAITKDGKIWSYPRKRGQKREGKFLTQHNNGRGYWMTGLSKNGKCIKYLSHRLVALTFIVNPRNFPQVNHINGNRKDNRTQNLEWVDNSGNMQNAIIRGSFDRKGAKHPLAKLNARKIRGIRKLLKRNMFHKEIASIYEVSPSLISQISRKLIWNHIVDKT